MNMKLYLKVNVGAKRLGRLDQKYYLDMMNWASSSAGLVYVPSHYHYSIWGSQIPMAS